jgi:hypothetical protein
MAPDCLLAEAHVPPISQFPNVRCATPRSAPPTTHPADSFPFEWIKKKWREAFHVTAMATSGTQVRKKLP